MTSIQVIFTDIELTTYYRLDKCFGRHFSFFFSLLVLTFSLFVVFLYFLHEVESRHHIAAIG